MSYQATGDVILINELQTFDSGFQKREFVIKTDERYPQSVKFECVKDKVEMVDRLAVGDTVTVDFDVRGNEYNGRHFVNLVCWRIDSDGAQARTEAQVEEDRSDYQEVPVNGSSDAEEETLPF